MSSSWQANMKEQLAAASKPHHQLRFQGHHPVPESKSKHQVRKVVNMEKRPLAVIQQMKKKQMTKILSPPSRGQRMIYLAKPVKREALLPKPLILVLVSNQTI